MMVVVRFRLFKRELEGEGHLWEDGSKETSWRRAETCLIISDLRSLATELGATVNGMPVDSECLTIACRSNLNSSTGSKFPRLELACLSHLIIVTNAIPPAL